MAKSVGHDPDALELHVEFPNGSVHVYEGVTAEKYGELMAAPSFGKAFNEIIRRQHESRRLPETPTDETAV
jgi:hypothetical protein